MLKPTDKALQENQETGFGKHNPHRHAQKDDKESEAAEKARGAIPPIPEHSSGPLLRRP
jgi:hypothetical protein